MRGQVFDIQHFCLNDGPGIRTTVFFKGCPLRCIWCHNPESYEGGTVLSYLEGKCTGCGECISICSDGAHKNENGQHMFDRKLCTGCLKCTNVCCYGALSQIGRSLTAKKIMKEVLQDQSYYGEKQEGGMTVSGGEPFMQAAFLKELLSEAHREGIHTCVETSGFAKAEDMEEVIAYADCFLLDIKAAKEEYRNLTGVDAEQIYQNLQMLMKNKKRTVIRIPLIPGINDSKNFFEELGTLYRTFSEIEGFEIMPYHNMGTAKAGQFGIVQGLAKRPNATKEQKQYWLEELHKIGIPAKINYFNCKQTDESLETR